MTTLKELFGAQRVEGIDEPLTKPFSLTDDLPYAEKAAVTARMGALYSETLAEISRYQQRDGASSSTAETKLHRAREIMAGRDPDERGSAPRKSLDELFQEQNDRHLAKQTALHDQDREAYPAAMRLVEQHDLNRRYTAKIQAVADALEELDRAMWEEESFRSACEVLRAAAALPSGQWRWPRPGDANDTQSLRGRWLREIVAMGYPVTWSH